ncbi:MULTISPECIES: hypothetical protein [unclassified Rhizobium]|uniref:hypothetical protein n=1 Tax=unclassified Rhizobium TaxID=2613769 RepID=UPI001ADB95DA|nr:MULTISPECIES: hypothetical protein [unclassified Rhizobium]MBO9125681.1 hypothetical protein [Rhizobium sp. 16-488-2b]MBO9176265.1 hypothetical protein [Rhizobium sp. 16-488-2a]
MLVVDFLLEVIGYTTARMLLPLASRGRIRVQGISSGEGGFNWLGFKRAADHSLLCEASMAGWIGLLPWVLLIAAIISFR